MLFASFNIVHIISAINDNGVFIYDQNRDYIDLALILNESKQELSDNNLAIDFNYENQERVQKLYMVKVARDKGKTVGAIFYNVKPAEIPSEWQIFLLVVDKNYRNQGYGTLMVKTIIADMIALEKDFVLVKISSMNKSAYHLFKNKCDFLELKWTSNPFRKNEYIEFLRPRYAAREDWSGQELDTQVMANQKLYDACKKFDEKKAKEAILEGANVHLRVHCNEDDDSYWNSRSPLYFAIEKNNIEFTRALIAAGVDITGVYEDTSPLAFAMHLDHVDFDMILLLIQAGSDVNAVDTWGRSLLCRAFLLDDLALAKALIDKGADIYTGSYCGSSLLDDALEKDDSEFVRLLIQAGYDVNRQDEEGCSGLHKAVHNICDDSIFEALLHAGANVYQVNVQGYTCLDIIDHILHEYTLKSFDHYRFNAEVDQLKKIKNMLLCW